MQALEDNVQLVPGSRAPDLSTAHRRANTVWDGTQAQLSSRSGPASSTCCPTATRSLSSEPSNGQRYSREVAQERQQKEHELQHEWRHLKLDPKCDERNEAERRQLRLHAVSVPDIEHPKNAPGTYLPEDGLEHRLVGFGHPDLYASSASDIAQLTGRGSVPSTCPSRA